MTVGARFARAATKLVLRNPRLWRLLRAPLRAQFDRLAPQWDELRDPRHLAAFERALDEVGEPPRRALDLGTGTGAAAFVIARQFPTTEVIGVDLADAMLAAARRKTPPDLAARVRFERADAAQLPYESESFDLVALANMIPFFDELARVAAPGATAIFSFSSGAETPIYVPPARLRDELARRGFTDFAEFAAAKGTSLLARKPRAA